MNDSFYKSFGAASLMADKTPRTITVGQVSESVNPTDKEQPALQWIDTSTHSMSLLEARAIREAGQAAGRNLVEHCPFRKGPRRSQWLRSAATIVGGAS